MGWTGQPTIAVRDDRTWAIFGGYDGHIHFMDADTGERILPDVETGDIIKGTPTIDPDGFPLVYSGSRDDLCGSSPSTGPGQAEVLWTLDSESVAPEPVERRLGLVADHPRRLHDRGQREQPLLGHQAQPLLRRGRAGAGRPPRSCSPSQAWDRRCSRPTATSTRRSRARWRSYEDTAYFGTSAGLVWGYDLSRPRRGQAPERVFRFYTAGDNDASLVVDDEGMLYVAAQNDRPGAPSRARSASSRSSTRATRPTPSCGRFNETSVKGGHLRHAGRSSATPIVVTSDAGRLIGLDRGTGAVQWETPARRSGVGQPGDRRRRAAHGRLPNGDFHAFDMSDPDVEPPELWSVNLGGCIEATPAVWNGQIYIGSRSRLPLRPRVVDVARLRRAPPSRAAARGGRRGGRRRGRRGRMSTGLSCQRYSRRDRPESMTSAASSRPT